jgi:hypothetical protein
MSILGLVKTTFNPFIKELVCLKTKALFQELMARHSFHFRQTRRHLLTKSSIAPKSVLHKALPLLAAPLSKKLFLIRGVCSKQRSHWIRLCQLHKFIFATYLIMRSKIISNTKILKTIGQYHACLLGFARLFYHSSNLRLSIISSV